MVPLFSVQMICSKYHADGADSNGTRIERMELMDRIWLESRGREVEESRGREVLLPAVFPEGQAVRCTGWAVWNLLKIAKITITHNP